MRWGWFWGTVAVLGIGAAVALASVLALDLRDERQRLNALEGQPTPPKASSTFTRGAAAPTAVARAPRPRPTSAPARTATPTPNCSIASSAQTVIASTVKVVTGGGNGTAFYMGNSEFITAAHVVEGYPSVRLEAPGLSVVAQVVGLSSSADVAILRASTSLKPLEWGSSSILGAGEFVGVAGYSFGSATSGTQAAFSRGVVSRILSVSGQNAIQTDAAVSPGSSGGPAFNVCGRVIGMVTQKIQEIAVEGIAFVFAESSVRAALPDARAHPLIGCATREFTVGVGSTATWTFGTLSAGAWVSGGFSVEPGGFGDLDVRFHLVDQLGQSTSDTIQTSAGNFEFPVSAAGAHAVAFDNSYSLFTLKNIAINWCVYG